jgi:hypothetical protein
VGICRHADSAAPLNASALALVAYESERPSDAQACRVGDPRVLVHATRRD